MIDILGSYKQLSVLFEVRGVSRQTLEHLMSELHLYWLKCDTAVTGEDLLEHLALLEEARRAIMLKR